MENQYKKYPITITLIGICVVVYIISVLKYGMTMSASDAISFGGYNPLLVYLKNDYYRLITANFIHFGLMHIVVNCYSLYNIGTFIERVLDRKKYIIVLFTSALATTLLPYLLFLLNGFEINTVSGGISGVIFGLIGALAALALIFQNEFMTIFKNLAMNLVLMIVISITVPSISLSGHVSGFIGGFVVTYLLYKVKRVKTQKLYN